jgi:hypothetical protein
MKALISPLPLLTLALAACSADPRTAFRRAVASFAESGDDAAFRAALAGLSNQEVGEGVGLLPALPEYAEPDPTPRLHILSPRGLMRHHDLEQPSLVVRWFDARAEQRRAGDLSLRLFSAKRKARGEPELPRQIDELNYLSEALLAESTDTGGGVRRFLLPTQWLPPGWLALQIRDPFSPVRPETKIEDTSWFASTWSEGGRLIELELAKRSLKALCDAMGLASRESELLLARLLVAHEFLLGAARLLELMEQEGNASPASRALLALAYRGLGRPPGVPREPAARDDEGLWRDPYLPDDLGATRVRSGPMLPEERR